MAAVLFADLVGFSKKSVPAQLAAKEALTGLLQRLVTPYPSAGRVVLDTGDGAAVGFLVSPEYALGLALRLRRELVAAPAGSLLQSQDLRLGINLGPLKVVTDVNGHPNLVGEGINSAERIMSFAEPGDTTASRSFQEAVYYLDASFQSLFEPLGMRADKHGREHEVFRLTTSGPAIDAALESLGVGAGPGDSRGAGGRAAAIAASSTRSLGGLAALGGPARIGLVAAVLLVVVGTGAWVAWPARQVARETAAPSSAAPREAAVPVTTPSPASSETTPPAAAPPAVAAPVPAASAGASASGASGAPGASGASGESEQASRAVQGSPASLRAPARPPRPPRPRRRRSSGPRRPPRPRRAQ
jgi:class 3 adenylate cyclase